MFHDALKAKPYRDEAVRYAQHKLDGHRLVVYRDAEDIVAVTTTFDDLYPVLKDYPWAAAFRKLPPRSSLDGELLVPNHQPSVVKTAIKARDSRLAFVPFAVPFWNGQDLALETLHRVSDFALSIGLSFSPYKELSVGWTKQALLEECEEMNLEGMVLKLSNYRGWFKLKRTKTIDLVVTDTVPGRGKYTGQVGALVCSTIEGYEVANVSGMTDADRLMMGEHTIGDVVEIKYQSVGTQGRLRHPRFLRIRDDKIAEDCSALQDPILWRSWNPE